MDSTVDQAAAAVFAADISIILCTCGRARDLESTLASLACVAVPAPRRVELLVVENGAESGARAIVAGFHPPSIRVAYHFIPTVGKSRALNHAVGLATGTVLLFTDDDVRFPEHWIERMCTPILQGRADAVAGGVALAPSLLRPWMNHTHRAWLANTADYLSPTAPSEMCGANMAVRRDVLLEIGGFDPELGPGVTAGGEESLASWQIRQAGYRVAGAFDVAVEHHLNPQRLLYSSWIKSAVLQGRKSAYLLHHWHHRRIRFPRLLAWHLRLKLALRSLAAGRRRPDDEGIAPWELSYREDISKCACYLRERRRPRNYSRAELRKLNSERPALAS